MFNNRAIYKIIRENMVQQLEEYKMVVEVQPKLPQSMNNLVNKPSTIIKGIAKAIEVYYGANPVGQNE